MKVRMYPHISELGNQVGGIAEVVKAYFRFLPQFDIELVDPDATTYDLIASHAGITGGECSVAHTHGLYWTADYNADEWEYRVNARIVEAIRSAKAVTVPSAWVAEALQRDCRLNPFVIPHGIVWQEWQHKEENAGYVLYTKTRNADVCDNSILDILTQRFPEVRFVSTLPTSILSRKHTSEWPSNFKIIETGAKTPHEQMRRFIQRAGIYLSVAKETFGLGTLEAMASGIPVLGWNFGGNSFLVQHGVNGYLAQPGNIEDLCEGLDYCLKHRKTLGANGRELAKRWTWEAACEKVAGIYQLAMEEQPATVGVVIPVYNKPDEQLRRAIESVKNQTFKPERIIVVNDGSTEYNEEIEQLCRDYLITADFYYQRTINQGVAGARNYGISLATSKYICCVDADDWLESTFLETCVKELEQNRSLGIAYTGLRAWNEDGSSIVSQWPGQFNSNKQLMYPKQNQVPTACVFRREAWERVGGYKSRYCPYGAGSEDAAFWSAICSIGYRAKKVTDEALFNYSASGGFVHANKEYAEVDWLSMYPWAKDKQHPFASVATPERISHQVRQYDEPLISVIIPVGPGHEKEVQNALDSLEMQTFRKWEVVIIVDFEDKISPYGWIDRLKKAYPYVRERHTGGKGAGFARNRGASIARAPLLFFLDADDVLASPDALQKMLDAWNQQEAIIYSDYLGKAQWDLEEAEKEFKERLLGYNSKQGAAIFRQHAADFDPELAQRQPEYNASNPRMPYYHWCLVSVLVPKLWHDTIGGFDESMATWEDVDYHWRLARNGYCFFRVPESLVMYAYHKGHRREKSAVKDENSLHQHKSMIQYIRQKYEGLEVKVCNCGKRKQPPTAPNGVKASGMNDSDFVMIEFHFPGDDTRTDYGKSLISPTGQIDSSGRKLDYHGYARRKGDKFLVHKQDQQSRPDMFRVISEVAVLEAPKEELPEPVLLKAADTRPLEESKRRGRKARV